jgi:hypothetical protein
MPQVTEEDERRIREKYGDLLDKIEEERKPLSGKQCLDLLPPEAPRSDSIFTSGFYFNGRGIKYRTSLVVALIPYRSCVINVLNFLLLKLFVGALAVSMFRENKIFLSLCAFISGYQDIISSVIDLTLLPYIEIDLNNKIVRIGRIFISKIPFSKIDLIEVRQIHHLVRTAITGTYVLLSYSNSNIINVASLHTWEEDDCIEIIKESLMCLLGKELQVKYTSSWGKNYR